MKKFVATILAFISLSAFGTTPKEAYQMAKEGKAVIVDVREQNEIKEGMIDHAQWFPLSKIKENKNWKKDFEKMTDGKQIFLYCRSGNRSGQVQEILKKEGIPSENIGGYETLKTELPVKR